MSSDKVRYMFLRNADGSPCGCLAISIDNNLVSYGLSTLNPRDKFNRKLARSIARDRLALKPFEFQLTLDVEPNMHIISSAVMEEIACNSMLPNRTRRAAERWLHANVDVLYQVM